MYAVVVTGGKQYRVMKGETLRVELLDVEAGSEIKFDNVLMLGDGEGVKLGDALKGASVTATVKSATAAPTRSASSSSAAASTIASRWATGSITPKSRSPASPVATRSKEQQPWHIKRA